MVETNTKEIQNFKKILEYFVAHLEWLVDKNDQSIAYLKYIKPWIEDENFVSVGQGYDDGRIQRQIADWDQYSAGQICINVQPNFGSYKSTKCYLNWEGTGVNIVANWSGDKIISLRQEEYIYWEKPPHRIDLMMKKDLVELDLFVPTTSENQNLIDFFNSFQSALINFIKHKKIRMSQIIPYSQLLTYKKQIILQGPPGTGKTKLAKEIAQYLVGVNSVLTQPMMHQFLKEGQELQTRENYPFVISKVIPEENRIAVFVPSGGKTYSINFNEIDNCIKGQAWSHPIKEFNNSGNGSYSVMIAKYLEEQWSISQVEKEKQYKIIQFHPSYTYEDFVRGIVAEANGSSIGYKNVNKILGSFADEAFKNYESSTQEESFLSRNEWLNEKFDDFIEGVQSSIDEKGEYRLNDKVKLVDLDESAFYYTGDSWEEGVKHRMKFRDIKDAFFSDPQDKKSYKKLENISGSAKQHYGYYFKIFSDFKSTIKEGYVESKSTQVETKKYVLIVDEINRANLSSVLGELIYALEYRGQPVESIYSVEDSVLKSQIILSPNLYIIGTMNTADRSVGHIDYAIRRRFAFVDIFPKSLSEELGNDFKVAAFKTVAELFVKSYDESIDYSDISTNIERSEYLTHDFDPKDVWLGHSYFIQQYEKNAKGEDDKNKAIDFQLRIDYEIKPILEEYIKDGILKESARAVIEILEKTGANA